MTTSDHPTFNATLISRKDTTPYLSIVRIASDTGHLPPFTAGQFCTLGMPAPSQPNTSPTALEHAAGSVHTSDSVDSPASPNRIKLIRRAYSIASPPSQTQYLELFIVLVQEGKLTPRLWSIEQGGRLFLDPRIKGEFTLEQSNIPTSSHLVTISTGTGIAPFLSIYRQYRQTNRWNRFIMIHGVRQSQDLAYLHELSQLAADDPTLLYLPTCSNEPTDSPWTGLRGRVQSILEPNSFPTLTGFPLHPDSCHVLLCGNPQMIQSVQTQLAPHGFTPHSRTQPGNLHYERYW